MRVEFQDTRPNRDEKSEKVSLEMPEDIGQRFQAHLQRKRAMATEHGRKLLVLNIEDSL
ncbi:MAG TPA: hypothetical protein VNW47_04500 [Terriglobales bacterium]|nr:hypothetical protein [Terriglobales bacterium]